MEASINADCTDTQTRLSRITLGIVHDPLTGLRSHSGLLQEIGRDASLACMVDTHNSIVVSVHSPDEFGDRILALVGMRISRSIRAHDTAAHLGNGEFVVIVADHADVPIRTAARLKLALNLPYVIDGREVQISYTLRFARLRRDNLLTSTETIAAQTKLP